MKKIFLYLVLVLACTISMTSCNEESKDPGNVHLTDIAVTELIEVDVRVDSVVVNISASPIPANATDVDFKWESKNENVAIVEKDNNDIGVGRVTVFKGNITIHKSDSAIITVSSGQVTKEIKVKAFIKKIPVTGITLAVADTVVNDKKLSLPVGETVVVTAIPIPAAAEDPDFVSKSNNSNVATVELTPKTEAGIQKADIRITVNDTGKDTITVSSGEIYSKIVIEGIAADDE